MREISYLVLTSQPTAWEYPGAQVYPSCFQIALSGSGSGQPTDLVSFPGEYTADTPGVIFDVYQDDSDYPVSWTIFLHAPCYPKTSQVLIKR
jgi:hypothetical protein